MDIHTRQGKYAASKTYPVRLPCTLGMEGAGEVVRVGSEVTRAGLGDRVAWCISWGSYAEYACVPEALIARLPDAIGFDVAAASVFQGCTAHYLVHDVAQLMPGSTCLIQAASGSVGQLLIQFAKRLGAIVYATASTPAKCEVARRLGGCPITLPMPQPCNAGQTACSPGLPMARSGSRSRDGTRWTTWNRRMP